MAKQEIPPLRRPNRAVNTFNKGMAQDRAPAYLDNATYFESINGRIIFNKNGTYAWENIKGNKQVLSLPAGYFLLGEAEYSDKVVVFSSNDVNSEIGIVTINADATAATYTTIFNDKYDPNGDLLHFRFDAKMECVPIRENTTNKEETFFNDRKNVLRVINLDIGKKSISPQFVNGDYQPIGAPLKYPWFYSVQSMSYQTDIMWGRIYFQSIFTPASGTGIKTGVLQYTYQLETRTGYRTPWSPPTRGYFNTIYPNPIITMHDINMYASNVNSGHGFNLVVSDVDDRYYKLRVAYIYTIDSDATVEFTMFREIMITPGVTSYPVQHENHSGTPINFSELTTDQVSIDRVETIKEKGNRLWMGGVDISTGFLIDTSKVTIDPFLRDMTADILTDKKTVPFTNTNPTTTFISTQKYLDNTGTPVTFGYPITEDYQNYHGIQWTHLFTGHWRGETYPYALNVYDRRGFFWFAIPLKDYTFPNQYDDDDAFDLMDTAGILKLLGIKVGGIDITDLLWDQYGDLRISAIAITRVKDRKPRTLCQGIVTPTVWWKFGSGDDDEDNITRPLPTLDNAFSLPYYSPTGLTHDDQVARKDDGSGKDYGLRPETVMFHSPELMFGYPIWEGTDQSTVIEDIDVLKMVSKSFGKYTNNAIGSHWTDFIELQGNNFHFYSKQYNVGGIDQGAIALGEESRIRLMGTTVLGKDIPAPYDINQPDLQFDYTAYWYNPLFTTIGCTDPFRAAVTDNAWLLKTKDFEDTHLAINDHLSGLYLANYIVARSSYYTPDNETSLEKRLYIPTGHFQPITKAILETVKTADNRYIFNGMEVWGGDCYVNLWDFTRIVPQYSDDCDSCYDDHAHSYVVPIESFLNLALRRGRTFAAFGTKPEIEACTTDQDNFPNGIQLNQPEDSFLNSVLQFQENIVFYPAVPANLDVLQSQFPLRWYYSELKFAGEIVDNYRRILVNNFGDLPGVHGKITGSAVLFDQIYSFQSSAYGRLRIDERATITTKEGEETQVGSGKTLADQPIDYIFGKTTPNASFGCQHPFTIMSSKKSIYWIDIDKKTFCRHGQDGFTPLSDQYELHDFANAVLPIYQDDVLVRPPNGNYRHIHGAYDANNNAAVWTMLSSFNGEPNKTVTFNEDDRFNAFETFITNYPFIYITHKGLLFANNPNPALFQNVYVYNIGNRGVFFEEPNNSTLTLTVNINEKQYKTFDTLICNIDKEALSLLIEVKFTTEEFAYSVFPPTDTRVIYRYGELLIPVFALGQNKRMQGKYMTVDFIFKNEENKRVIFTSLDTAFRFAKPN